MKKILCISGKAEDVRNTVANIIRTELIADGSRVLITHLSAPLEQLCRDWFHWDGKKDHMGRTLLHCIGMEIVREENPNFWVDFTFGLLAMMRDEWEYAIIPDCQFKNELDLSRFGFETVHLRVGEESASSELRGVEADWVIFNDTSSLSLHEEIHAFISGALVREIYKLSF